MSEPLFFHLQLNLYTILGIATLGPLLMMSLDAMVARAAARGWLLRTSNVPSEPVGIKDFKFMASFVMVTGALGTAAQYLLFLGRSLPIDLGVRPLEMLAFTTLLLLLVDTNGFFWHRLSHKNFRVFRRFHDGHHQHGGNIHVGVAFHSNNVWDYPLHSGISLTLGISLLVVLTERYPVVTICYAISVYVLALAAMHSGIRETAHVKWVLRVLLLPMKIVPTAIRIEDHTRHHAQANCNYGVFFSHWDRLLGSWVRTSDAPAHPRSA